MLHLRYRSIHLSALKSMFVDGDMLSISNKFNVALPLQFHSVLLDQHEHTFDIYRIMFVIWTRNANRHMRAHKNTNSEYQRMDQ